MSDIETTLKEFDKVSEQILSGEYDNAEEIVAKYNELKKKLEDAGVKILDGIDFENIIM